MKSDLDQPLVVSDEEALWQLVKLPGGEKQSLLLDQLCAGDSEQRKRLVELLRHQAAAERLFQSLDGAAEQESDSIKQTSAQTRELDESLFDTPRELAALGNLRQLGNYRLSRLVGRGGMGNVFHAYDEKLHREVAIKIPRMDLMFLPGLEQRFLREAQAAARLDHPNLVSILQVGTEGPVPFIATQWCDRGDLSTWMRKSPNLPSPTELAEFMADVADAIQHCHDCGVVHLDLKPSNILLMSETGDFDCKDSLTQTIPKVTDFGLARLLESQLDTSSTSMFLGTPLYMAPEQAECKRELIGPTSDIFSLGVVIHELSSGSRPFDGETLTTILDQVRQANTASSMAMRQVPRDLRTIVSRCLQRDPADRYATAGLLADDLRRFASSKPIQAQPVPITRRLWLWCRRPERITQAGVVSIAVQLAVLANLYSHFVFLGLGVDVSVVKDHWSFFLEGLPVALFLHVPMLLNGFRTVGRRQYSFSIGLLLSIVFVAALAALFFGWQPAFSIYQGNDLAAYVAHLFIFCLAMIQLIVHMVALPAAFGKNR